MGYICSKCKDKSTEDEQATLHPELNILVVDRNEGTNPKQNTNIISPAKKKESLSYPKLSTGVSGSSPYLFSDNIDNNYNYEIMNRSHMDYESYNSPSFQNRAPSNLILESIHLDDEVTLRDDFPNNYDFPINNSSVFGRLSLSHLDDKSFDGDSFDNSFMPSEYKNQDYISMSSTSIITDNRVNETPSHELDIFEIKNISNVLLRKSYIIVYFELNYFMLWSGNYIRSVYPENNLVLVVQLNDDVRTSEIIPLVKSKEDFKWKPMLKKEDTEKKSHRMIKFLLDDNTAQLDRKPIKLSIEIGVFTMNKLSTISYEEFFFSTHSDTEMHKYILYPNTYMKYNNKKMGNLNFAFMFKLDRINFTNGKEEKSLTNEYMNLFNRKDRLITFNEDPNLQLRYYEIPNIQYKSGGKSNFMSLSDIQVEVESYLKNDKISIDKLLELISDNNTKYELYDLLKKLHDRLCKKEFNDEKLSIFKEKLSKLLMDIKQNKECFDKIVIPFIFNLLKLTFFKVNKIPLNKDKKTIKKLENNNSNIAKFTPKDIEMIINIFYYSLNFIDPVLSPEICLSALNYISKIIEENFVMMLNINLDKRITSEDFFINYIISKKKYLDLCDLLLYMSDNPACTMPITMILTKVLKTKKEETKQLVSILKQDRFREVFKEILKTHDCNSIVMANIITILLQIIDYIEIEELFQIISFSKLREIFNTFRVNGFDVIHDSIIGLIKAILIKKNSNSNKQMTLTLDDADYSEIVLIFITAIFLIRTRIIMINDFNRLSKSLYNLLSHVYTICNIINNINEKNELVAHRLCIEKKMPELLIECLSAINDKKIFTCIDNGFDKFDIASVNTKMIIFRALYHCILLIQNLRKIEAKSVSKIASEKFYKIIKIIEDNDENYNPQSIMKNYEKFKGKPDESYKISAKNLLDYYGRYKHKLPEIADELISILKG